MTLPADWREDGGAEVASTEYKAFKLVVRQNYMRMIARVYRVVFYSPPIQPD